MHFEGDPVSNMTLELFCLKNSAQAGEMPALTSALTDAFASASAASFIWDLVSVPVGHVGECWG